MALYSFSTSNSQSSRHNLSVNINHLFQSYGLFYPGKNIYSLISVFSKIYAVAAWPSNPASRCTGKSFLIVK
jgi:hypothetical protein